jgi:hypothetical protein
MMCVYKRQLLAVTGILLISVVASPLQAQPCDNVPDHFLFASNTGDYYAIVLDSTGLDCNLSVCDEVGIYDGTLCVGAAVFEGTWPLAITAWADDPQTGEVDGFAEGNPISYRVWRSSAAGIEFACDHSYDTGTGVFGEGVYARLWLSNCGPCGDVDGSGTVNTADVVCVLGYIFGNPCVDITCRGDVDCSGGINTADGVYLLGYIFGVNPPPCDACP